MIYYFALSWLPDPISVKTPLVRLKKFAGDQDSYVATTHLSQMVSSSETTIADPMGVWGDCAGIIMKKVRRLG